MVKYYNISEHVGQTIVYSYFVEFQFFVDFVVDHRSSRTLYIVLPVYLITHSLHDRTTGHKFTYHLNKLSINPRK